MSNKLGVQPFLNEEAKIFYTENLKSKNLGRVSDVTALCLKEKCSYTLEIRAALTYALYFGYSLFEKTEFTPRFSFEIGFDDEGIYCGLSIHSGVQNELKLDEKTSVILAQLNSVCKVVHLKQFKKISQIEIILKINEKNNSENFITEMSYIDESHLDHEKNKNYIELGDVDYSNLILDEKFKNQIQTEDKKIFKNDQKEEEYSRKISSSPEAVENNDEAGPLKEEISKLLKKINHLEKNNDDLKEKLMNAKLSKSGSSTNEKSSFFAKLFSPKNEKSDDEDRKTFSKNGTDKDSSEKKFTKDSSQLEESQKIVSSIDEESEGERIIVFKASKEESSLEDEEQILVSSQSSDENNNNNNRHHDSSKNDHVVFEKDSDNIKELKANELQSILSEVNFLKDGSSFRRVLREMEETPEEQSHKLKKWREELKREMMIEASRIQDIAKELNRQSRQLENEFLAKERMASTELRKKDEQIRQKESILLKKNELVAQLNVSIEKFKTMNTTSEDQGYKLKLQNANKLLQMKDDEAKVFAQKVKDLENKLMAAQSKSTKSTDTQSAVKLAAAEKRVEEFKRMNQRLTETLERSQEKRGEQDNSDSRRKLEVLDRQYNESKKTLEKVSLKLKEIQDHERKNQIELGKLQEENRKLKQTLNRNGSGGQNSGSNSSGGDGKQAA